MMRLTDFLNVHVVTESGDNLGRIHDLRAERSPRTSTSAFSFFA